MMTKSARPPLLRWILPLCSALLVALGAGCGYDCRAECLPMAEALADQGYNPDTEDENGGYDPDTVCDIDAIVEATTCEECRDAIEDTYRLINPQLQCQCPKSADEEILYFDEGTEEMLRGPPAEVCPRVDYTR